MSKLKTSPVVRASSPPKSNPFKAIIVIPAVISLEICGVFYGILMVLIGATSASGNYDTWILMYSEILVNIVLFAFLFVLSVIKLFQRQPSIATRIIVNGPLQVVVGNLMIVGAGLILSNVVSNDLSNRISLWIYIVTALAFAGYSLKLAVKNG